MSSYIEDKLVKEKLVARGVQALSDGELLSLLIQQSNSSHLELAKSIIDKYDGNLNMIANQSLKNLRMSESMGIKNASSILAAMELGRRASQSESKNVNVIRSNRDIYQIFRPILAPLTHEEFWVLYLSASNSILDKAKIGQGGVQSIAVDHKIIIKRAVELLASGLVLVHNHPSGNSSPSEEDIVLTEKLSLGASLFEITLVDHIIITPSDNVSFKQLGIF